MLQASIEPLSDAWLVYSIPSYIIICIFKDWRTLGFEFISQASLNGWRLEARVLMNSRIGLKHATMGVVEVTCVASVWHSSTPRSCHAYFTTRIQRQSESRIFSQPAASLKCSRVILRRYEVVTFKIMCLGSNP